jgi:hypothetical protein
MAILLLDFLVYTLTLNITDFSNFVVGLRRARELDPCLRRYC